jgi:hypothetical protein
MALKWIEQMHGSEDEEDNAQDHEYHEYKKLFHNAVEEVGVLGVSDGGWVSVRGAACELTVTPRARRRHLLGFGYGIAPMTDFVLLARGAKALRGQALATALFANAGSLIAPPRLAATDTAQRPSTCG